MKSRELVTRLLKEGFVEVNCKKHRKFRHPDGRVAMVSKGQRDIPMGTLRAIEKQTRLKLTANAEGAKAPSCGANNND